MKVRYKGGFIVEADYDRYIWLKASQQVLHWDTFLSMYPDIFKKILDELNIKYDENIKIAYSHFEGKTLKETEANLITLCNNIKTVMRSEVYDIDDIDEMDMDNHMLILNREEIE